jgi:hypothetical protein
VSGGWDIFVDGTPGAIRVEDWRCGREVILLMLWFRGEGVRWFWDKERLGSFAWFFVEVALYRVLEVLLRQRVPEGTIKETAGVL